jgi:putative nucleotidyltransferase with HDIG domain
VTGPLDDVRAALAAEPAWLVGGAVRDKLLGRPTDDLDIALDGDAERAAKALRRQVGGAAFPLSDTFGGWRVIAPGHAWQVDILPLTGGTLESDLAARDLTINAMAEPVGGGELVDPHGGAADLAARVVRMVGPKAFASDPLRVLRAVRLAAELDMVIEETTLGAAREHAPALENVAAERIFAELKRIVTVFDPVAALHLLEAAGGTAAVLPELLELRGIDQSVYHHADVHDHTLDVLAEVVALENDAAVLGAHGDQVVAALREPLADGLSHWGAMRFAALLHDIAKPQTRRERPDGRGASFVGHDREGADVARAVLRRLRAAERLVEYVAALTLHHLRLGFLVHEQPLERRSVFRYLQRTAPYSVDVTVFTCADRLATRGRNAADAIDAHLDLARTMLAFALEPRPSAPLLRGDELAAALGIQPGPRLGELLAKLEEDRFAGDISTREEAIERARGYL